LAGGIIIIREFGRDLLEHLMEAHPNVCIILNESLELLNDRVEFGGSALAFYGTRNLPLEPVIENMLVSRHPSTNAVVDNESVAGVLGRGRHELYQVTEIKARY
jgi:hypothetical protein